MRFKGVSRLLPQRLFSHRYLSFSCLVLLIPILVSLLGCPNPKDYEIVISNYDPAQAYNGTTFFQTNIFLAGLWRTDMEGNVSWEYPHDETSTGFNLMQDGNVLAMPLRNPVVLDGNTGATLWTALPIQNRVAHHSILETPWGTLIFLGQEWIDPGHEPWGDCSILGDTILEIDYDSTILWEWHMSEHVNPVEHHPEGLCEWTGMYYYDWSHCNTVKLLQDYTYNGHTYEVVLLLLSRELDTFYMIDYPGGNIIWSCGQHGTFGRREPPLEPLFNRAHEIEMLENGNFVLFDNSPNRPFNKISRALEIAADPVAGTAEEAWSWTDPEKYIFNGWGGDADRLPNGNTMLTDVEGGRLIEVNPVGEKVWEMRFQPVGHEPTQANPYSTFMFKRVADDS